MVSSFLCGCGCSERVSMVLRHRNSFGTSQLVPIGILKTKEPKQLFRIPNKRLELELRTTLDQGKNNILLVFS